MNTEIPLPPERMADYQKRMEAAQEDLKLTRRQEELTDEVLPQLQQLGQLDQLKKQEAAKDAAHDKYQDALMAILEETNATNKRIIQKLLVALGKQTTANAPPA